MGILIVVIAMVFFKERAGKPLLPDGIGGVARAALFRSGLLWSVVSVKVTVICSGVACLLWSESRGG